MLKIFNIQRFSLHDGNGIRTNIFFKGCPLRCIWCNNPESIDPSPSIMFDERLCQRFGECIKAGDGNIFESGGRLVINRDKISDTNALADICPAKALWIAGREMSVEQIVAEVVKDISFFETSGGGVTLSGGEPFAQGEELMELLIRLRQLGIHIAAETSLHVPWEKVSKCLDLVDVFLADLKHADGHKFYIYTGGDLEKVLSNLRKLDSEAKAFIIRVPVIPGFNHTESEMSAIIDIGAELRNLHEIQFIPYHSLATEKYHMLGMNYSYSDYMNVDKSELDAYSEYAEKRGLISKILN